MLLYDEIIKLITEKSLFGSSPLDLLDGNEPQLNDSFSELINKLSCCTTQMWHNQDVLYKMRFMTSLEFIATYDGKLDEVHKCLKRACDLNVQRARLMDAIDKKILDTKMNGVK